RSADIFDGVHHGPFWLWRTSPFSPRFPLRLRSRLTMQFRRVPEGSPMTHPAAAPAKATLITFPPSLDCELGRFVLGYYAIPYEEVRHTVLFSFISTLWHGATLHFPLLYGGGGPTIHTARKMIDQFDASCPADRKLLLAGSDHDAVEADWTHFSATLGGSTAVYAYFHLLPHRAIMIRPLTEGTPPYEVAAVRAAYPLFAGFLKLALHLSPESAEKALGQIRQVVQSVDARLAD